MLSQQIHPTTLHEATRAETKPADRLETVKRIGTGLALILFPLLFVFAFAVHPGLLNPHVLTPQEVILRARGNALLAFGHVLVLFDAALLIVVTLHFMHLLKRGPVGWAVFIGAAFNVIGAVLLAAEKGAESLTISALSTIPDKEFAQMMPGLVAIFSHQGWMALVMGIALIGLGFSLQAAALFATKVIPRWQSVLLFIGIWLLGAPPDGLEIVSLAVALLLTVALVPYGVQLIRNRNSQGSTEEARGAQ